MSPAVVRLDVLGVQVEVSGADDEAVLAAAARAAIERSSRLLLHAGAVARDGAGVLFPGTSGTGKSTMVAACLRRGMGYLTDEMVALEPGSGAVEGWARPLMLTPWSMRAVGLPVGGDDHGGDAAKRAVPAAALGADVVTGLVPVAHVVVLRRNPSATATATATAVTPMPAGEVLAELLTASFNHYRHGAAAWETTAELARQARGWYLDAADLDAAADAVAALSY